MKAPSKTKPSIVTRADGISFRLIPCEKVTEYVGNRPSELHHARAVARARDCTGWIVETRSGLRIAVVSFDPVPFHPQGWDVTRVSEASKSEYWGLPRGLLVLKLHSYVYANLEKALESL